MHSDALTHYRVLVEEILDGSGRRTFTQTVQAAYDALPDRAGAALAGSLRSWTVLVEPNGFQGVRPEVLSRLARQGRALSVFWNDPGRPGQA
ncbi:hypothetical protein DMB42_11145 [Nonomuraea sp. WAC 01424]|uniref:DUF6461 domain-containing protein n=1 Tax=Nonomuraea sp. WAC 01424 TaxID=2203200 RepID=UPI000F78395A|nr:hypothetical protein [Nonomuraea sp. WAC 01424]RSN12734.1 hypothetical protein DMB42_11145 [Nonomuraea sp. WAC 01424]